MIKHRSFFSLLAVTLLVLATAAILIGSRWVSAAPAWQAKVADWVMTNTTEGKEAEFLVILEDQADYSLANGFETKFEKGRFVRDTLLAKAESTQASIIQQLKFIKKTYRSFYIVNAILVTGGRDVVELLASRPDVARIEGNPQIQNKLVAQPTEEEVNAAIRSLNSKSAPDAVELGVTTIRAPEVWATGFTGQGIVIGGADTGIKWDHNALKNKYRGWNGTTANHNYNWHDSIHSGGGVCGPDSTAPCDDNGHGTHTVGTVLGDDGGTNQVGVAPGAKFIGCRNMDQGNGTPARYIECMEWFLAPYPVGGTTAQGDVTKAPHITTNSWGCPAAEGCSPSTLQAAVEAQRAAGIMMVVAAGNSGSACSTVSDPPSFYAASYTVGAISASSGAIASFSSRGPATADGSNRLKPEITAPGVSVRSATNSSVSSYTSLNGTSMATPHVAGAIALLWSARPALVGQIQQTIDALNQSAVHVSSTLCNSNGVPNNTYGWGRLDIKAAYDATGCAYTLSPTSANFAATGGGNTVGVTAASGCAWTAASNNAWIQVTGGTPGSGNGTVNYTVTANNGPARNGSMTIAGQNFPVAQASGCTAITINPTLPNGSVGVAYNQTLSPIGGTPGYTFSVTGTLPTGMNLVSGSLTGTPTTLGTFNFTIQATDSLGCTGSQAYSVTIGLAGLQFYPLSKPVRLLDTRAGYTGCDSPGTPITGGTELIQLARRTCNGETIPANALAITGNVTPVPSNPGWLTLFPSNATRPTVANSNFIAGEVVNNVFTVGLGTDGSFKIYASATTEVVVDVSGYFAPPSASGLYFHPLPSPIRLLETRVGETGCDAPQTQLTGGSTRTQPGRVTCNSITIPSTAKALVGNATVVSPVAAGWLTLFPSDASLPLAANGNYTIGNTVNTPFTVGLGAANGSFNIFTTKTTDLVVDVLGYYSSDATDLNGAGYLFYSLLTPVRLLDSRPGYAACFTPNAQFTGTVEYSQQATGTCGSQTVPVNTAAVLGNVTTVNPASGFLTLWPSNVTSRPLAATSNFTTGQIANRHFIVGLGTDGAFKFYSSGNTHLIIELSGYFAP